MPPAAAAAAPAHLDVRDRDCVCLLVGPTRNVDIYLDLLIGF